LFGGEPEFHEFDVDQDDELEQPEYTEDDDPEFGQLHNIASGAEMWGSDTEDIWGPFHLTDVDGETVWLNPAEVAVIEIPL
jgi:hypothetical protein